MECERYERVDVTGIVNCFNIHACIEVCLGFRDVSRLHAIRVNLY